MVYFGGLLPNWDISRGFLCISLINFNFAGRISEAASAMDREHYIFTGAAFAHLE